MLSYLLDTNVVSETIKPRPNEGAIQWMDAADSRQCCLSVLTIAELQRGVALLEAKNAVSKARQLDSWLNRVREEYADRILDVTQAVAHTWACLLGKRTSFDSLIAATAATYDLTVVTRNRVDFEILGVRCLNPFTP